MVKAIGEWCRRCTQEEQRKKEDCSFNRAVKGKNSYASRIPYTILSYPSSGTLIPPTTEINVTYFTRNKFLRSLIELKQICHIVPPKSYFLTCIRLMKAFSALLILFFVAAALGLRLNVDHEKRRVFAAELRC